MIEAILWDFGGVFTSSPFEAFARFEAARGLPENFIRTVNATNPDSNAWARFESAAIDADEFDDAFRRESEAFGHSIGGKEVLELLAGEFRPRMAAALRECKRHYKVGCITNNMKQAGGSPQLGSARGTPSQEKPQPRSARGTSSQKKKSPAMADDERAQRTAAVMAQFDVVVESSVEGVRKPNPRIYQIACDRLGVVPERAIFLDDLGINLKPARAMGMTTIKVVTEAQAIEDLATATGLTFPG